MVLGLCGLIPKILRLSDQSRKSQIAIEYAYRMRERSISSVFWVHASNAARFEKGYYEIALEAKLPGVDIPKTDILDLVSRWLGTDDSGDWLMIVDNAYDATTFFDPNTAPVPRKKRRDAANNKPVMLSTSERKGFIFDNIKGQKHRISPCWQR